MACKCARSNRPLRGASESSKERVATRAASACSRVASSAMPRRFLRAPDSRSTYGSPPGFRGILEPAVNVAANLVSIDLASRGAPQVLDRGLRHLQPFNLLLCDRVLHSSHISRNVSLGKGSHYNSIILLLLNHPNRLLRDHKHWRVRIPP